MVAYIPFEYGTWECELEGLEDCVLDMYNTFHEGGQSDPPLSVDCDLVYPGWALRGKRHDLHLH